MEAKVGNERALLIRLGAIGDTLHASAVARLLKVQFPGMDVDFLASAGLEGLFSLIPEVNRVHALPFRRLPLPVHPAWLRLKRELNGASYSLAYLMETDPAFLPLLRGVRAERRVALALDEKHNGEPARGLPWAVRYQKLLWDLGLATKQILPARLVPDRARKKVARDCLVSLGMNPDAPLVGVHAGNSFRVRKKWRKWYQRADLRAWSVGNWGELILATHSMQPGIQFVLFGSRQDRPANRQVEMAVSGSDPAVRVVDVAGTVDLPQAAVMLSCFSLFLSTDTGPLHLAAALGVPLVGLYGPTQYDVTRPFCEEPGRAEVIRMSLPCQPCYGTSRQKTCRDNICMKAIRVEEVLACAKRVNPGLFGA